MPDEDVYREGEVEKTLPIGEVTIPSTIEIWANIFALAAHLLSISDAGQIARI